MIKQISIYITECTNPYINLATEKLLLDHVGDDEAILYLWQNKNTVVIGQNQNPWAECKCSQMEDDGVSLARRLSGGGAVFHDLGNLNFTFICQTHNYSVENNLSVIKKACAMAGIKAEISGRNDILADGRKFSGNAFYNSKGKSYHHGTIMINANMEKLGYYLTPSKAKLDAKGVKSVRSRVINLNELNPSLTIDQMKTNLKTAFEEVYSMKATVINDINSDEAAELAQKYGSREYLYGTQPPFTFACEDRFEWGSVDIKLNVEKGIIKDATVYSDSMDWELASIIKNALTGCDFGREQIKRAMHKHLPSHVAKDIADLFEKNEI